MAPAATDLHDPELQLGAQLISVDEGLGRAARRFFKLELDATEPEDSPSPECSLTKNFLSVLPVPKIHTLHTPPISLSRIELSSP